MLLMQQVLFRIAFSIAVSVIAGYFHLWKINPSIGYLLTRGMFLYREFLKNDEIVALCHGPLSVNHSAVKH